MKIFCKKAVSIVLVLTFIISLLPIAAFAADTDFNQSIYAADLLTERRVPAIGEDFPKAIRPILDNHTNDYQSSSKIWVSLLEDSPSFKGSMVAWEIYTFDPANITDDILDERDRYTTVLFTLLDAIMVGEDSVAAATLEVSDTTNNLVSGIVEALSLTEIDQYSTELLKDPEFVARVKEYTSLYTTHGAIADVSAVASDIIECSENILDFANKMAMYMQVANVQNDVLTCLNEMYYACPSDQDILRGALSDIITYCQDAFAAGLVLTKEAILEATSMTYKAAMDFSVQTAIELIGTMNPAVAAVLKALDVGRDLGKVISDVFFATSDTFEEFYNMRALTEIEDLMAQTVKNLEYDYKYGYYSDREECAAAYLKSIDMLFTLHEISCDFAINFTDTAFDKGIVSTIMNHDTAEEQKSVITSYKEVIRKSHDHMNTFWQIAARYDYPELFVDPDKKEIPIEKLDWLYDPSYNGVDMYAGETKNVDIVYYPANTTQRDVKITSSDDSIVAVEDGRLVALAEGDVTIRIQSLANDDVYVEKHITTKDVSVEAEETSLDLVFVVDTTGSMGDDIDAVKRDMHAYLDQLDATGLQYKVAIIDYRDFPERAGRYDYPYMVQLDFSTDTDAIQNTIDGLTLGYGGDTNETLYSALIDGLRELSWTEGAGKKVIVMGDAPALDPEPYTNYTLEYVIQALCGKEIESGYEPEESSGFFDALLLKASAEEEISYEIAPIIPGEQISVYTISTSGGASSNFEQLAEGTGGANYDSFSSADVSTVMSEIIADASLSVLHTHDMMVSVVNAALSDSGEVEPGLKKSVCAVCGYTEKEEITHIFEDLEVVTEPTCTETGVKKMVCSDCGLVEEVTLPALGHDYVSSVIEATCAADGSTKYTCSRCGDTYSEDIVPALGHTPETLAGKEATCTETGLTDGSKCSVCGEILTAQTEIPKLGHDYVATVTDATCTETGTTVYTCSRCDDTYTETIPATGHTAGEWKTVTPAEIGKEGLEKQSCLVCGAVLNERSIPALYLLGDADGDGKVTASDARKILRVAALLEIATDYVLLVGDVDHNGTLTAVDARRILRVAAKLDVFEENQQNLPSEEPTSNAPTGAEEPENPDRNQQIPETAVKYNGHYYQYYPMISNSWKEAVDYCHSLGGYLATISSQEENDFLYGYIESLDITSAYFGLTDKDVEGTWIWENGETSTYRNWHSGEPNGQNSNEDYAMFYYKFSDGTWNDGDFSQSKTVKGSVGFICEWD